MSGAGPFARAGPPPALAAGLDGWAMLGWAAALLGVVLLAYVLIRHLRRRVLEQTERQAAALTLEQFERLRAEGLLSDEEFRRARRVLVPAADAGAGDPAPPAAGECPAAEDEAHAPDEDAPPPERADGPEAT